MLLGVLDNPNSFLGFTKSIWGKDRIAAHDYTGANVKILMEKGGAVLTCVGPDGKILEKLGNSPPMAYPAAPNFVKSNYEKHKDKGLLADLNPPKGSEKILMCLKFAKYSEALILLKRAEDGPFKETLTGRLKALDAEKRRVFDVFREEGKTWEAYRVGESILRCFSKEKDLNTIRSYVSRLKSDATVKNELAARKAFASLLGQILRISGTKRVDAIKQAMESFIKKYSGTVCASVAEKIRDKANAALPGKPSGC